MGDIITAILLEISMSVIILGYVQTLAGSVSDYADGGLMSAKFMNPVAVAFNAVGDLFVGQNSAPFLRRITPSGKAALIDFSEFYLNLTRFVCKWKCDVRLWLVYRHSCRILQV